MIRGRESAAAASSSVSATGENLYFHQNDDLPTRLNGPARKNEYAEPVHCSGFNSNPAGGDENDDHPLAGFY